MAAQHESVPVNLEAAATTTIKASIKTSGPKASEGGPASLKMEDDLNMEDTTTTTTTTTSTSSPQLPFCITENTVNFQKRFPNFPATTCLHTVIGGRKSQEDRFCVCPNLTEQLENVLFMGVFDGTVGHFASDTVKDLVVPFLKQTSEYQFLEQNCISNPEYCEQNPDQVLKLLSKAFKKMYWKSDEELLKQAGIHEKHYASCTSVTLLLFQDYVCVGHLGDSRVCLMYINEDNLKRLEGLGVKKAVLEDGEGKENGKGNNDENQNMTDGTSNSLTTSSDAAELNNQMKNLNISDKSYNGKIPALDPKFAAKDSFRVDTIPISKVEYLVEGNFITSDHKPDTPEERTRIENSGGSVEYLHNHQHKPFIRGGDFQQRKLLGESPMQLQYSRAFGGKDLKPFGLSGDPTVNVTKRQRQFMGFILASDGLWDVLGADFASRLATKTFLESVQENGKVNTTFEGTGAGYPCKNASQALVEAALAAGSTDNITAVCVFYDTVGGDIGKSGTSGATRENKIPELYD